MTTSKNEGSGAPLAKPGTASPNRHTPESICSVNIIPYAADPFKQCRATMERKNAIRFMVIRQLDQRAFERLMDVTDLVMLDIKAMDEKLHRRKPNRWKRAIP